MLYSLMDTLYKNGIDYWHVSDNIIILFFLNCIYYLQKTNNCKPYYVTAWRVKLQIPD